MTPTEFTQEVLTLLSDKGMLVENIPPGVVEDFDLCLQLLLKVHRLRLPKFFHILEKVNYAEA